METTLKLRSLPFDSLTTYLAATVFVVGNILLPQLCHLMHQGGPTWLPIYFFTLIGAYRYGWRVGVLTALASPVVNSLLFGMPAVAMLPLIMTKSVILALVAAFVAARFDRVSLRLLMFVVVGSALSGAVVEWMVTAEILVVINSLKTGIPGLLLQIFGGWLVIIATMRKI